MNVILTSYNKVCLIFNMLQAYSWGHFETMIPKGPVLSLEPKSDNYWLPVQANLVIISSGFPCFSRSMNIDIK